jgi:hypothetical protein
MACGGEVAGVPQPSAPPPSESPPSESPARSVDPPAATATATDATTQRIPTDLDDEAARAICVEQSQRPKGTLSSDNEAYGVIVDVAVVDKKGLTLTVSKAVERTIDAVHGEGRTVSGWSETYSAPTEVGHYEAALVGGMGWKNDCFADGTSGASGGGTPGEAIPAVIDITARANGFIDGTIAMRYGKITFHAPIVEALSLPEKQTVCCLR